LRAAVKAMIEAMVAPPQREAPAVGGRERRERSCLHAKFSRWAQAGAVEEDHVSGGC